MKRLLVTHGLLLLCGLYIYAQDLKQPPDSLTLLWQAGLYKSITLEDSVLMISLPVLELPEAYKDSRAPLLPPTLDNSKKIWFRPAFNQAGYACGQAALVGYNFTYEMNFKRNVPGNVTDNQYPTHFVWNWMNEGNQYGGVSYYHTMEVLRFVGTPNVSVYGGMSEGGEKRWMCGYNEYYHAMHNRIENAYNIRTDTYEGFMTLKYWLFDHLSNAIAGGVASFYANQPNTQFLPPGTPEAGKYVATAWASSSTHALTIVGYNDSIRWDYNNDGQYTNNLDINGDGNITIKDWEIGGFKFVNSYGGVPGWADSGFCYMMYKTVADKFGEGGIWNNTVNVLKVKENCSPQLTGKIKIFHSCREQLKITMGVAQDTNATTPEHIYQFPIFNLQGGCLYMQGGTTEDQKTIEFGYDMSPLLNYITPGQPARFFLMVQEIDPQNWSNGYIRNFSLVNYTNGVQETPCNQTDVYIQQNTTTTLSIVGNINYSDVVITTPSLPPAKIYEPYSCQLAASGGTSPYFWGYDMTYDESSSSSTFPAITQQQLTPNNNSSGYAMKSLDFEFPFYEKTYDTVFIYVDGFLKFDDYLVTWPYFQDKFLRFVKNRNIAPFFDMNLVISTSQGDGLWYE